MKREFSFGGGPVDIKWFPQQFPKGGYAISPGDE